MTMLPGQLVGEDLLLVGDDALGQLGAGHEAGDRAGGDDQVVARELAGAAVVELDVDEVGEVMVPQPSISVILFFFIRKWTPLTMPSETCGCACASARSHGRVALDAELGLLVLAGCAPARRCAAGPSRGCSRR
jgi:hypothetical protein